MANAAHDIETIFTPDGEPHKCTRLNAVDLVRTHGYHWTKPVVVTASEAPAKEAPVKAEEPEQKAEEPKAPAEEPEAPAEDDEPSLANAEGTLEDVAHAVAGTDAETYLKGFSTDALKTLAEERYGLKLRANTTQENAIKKILEKEEEVNAEEPSDI